MLKFGNALAEPIPAFIRTEDDEDALRGVSICLVEDLFVVSLPK